jgi:hypothetical protein
MSGLFACMTWILPNSIILFFFPDASAQKLLSRFITSLHSAAAAAASQRQRKTIFIPVDDDS